MIYCSKIDTEMRIIRFSLIFLLSAIIISNMKAQTNWAEIGDPDWGHIVFGNFKF